MATYYWVGSSGNWSDAANHWSNSSGGSPSASYLPTATDDVVFDANSNTGTGAFTVTVDATATCQNFTASGLDGAMTMESSVTNVALDVYGSMSLPATNLSWSPTSGITLTFRGISSNTIATNGVTLNTTTIVLDAVGGTLTLASAVQINSTRAFTITNGTFSTSASNYTLTAGTLSSSNSNTRTINLNASAVSLTGTTPISISTITNLTFNAGTSTITCSATSPTFTGGGQTFYNVTFSSASNGTTTINGANTFNNLTQTSRSATGLRIILLGANQTVSGTLTLGAANTAIRRIFVASSTIGTQVTITLNGTLAALADVDFRDVNAAGSVATPWTGTRLGDCLGNANITFTAAKTVYWNLAGTQNWSATGWATTNNGAPAVNNFPLAQDTATFTEAGSAGTVTIETGWAISAIQMADGVSNRTTAFTLATGTTSATFYGNVTLFSSLTLTGTGSLTFAKRSATAIITSAGISWPQSLTINAPSGTFQLADNLTNTGSVFTLTQGTLDLSSGNRTLTCVLFSSSNSNTRTIAFGTGNITLTGSAATVFTTSTLTNLTITGTPVVNVTANASTGTRSITLGAGGLPEAQSISFNITAGSDTISLASTGGSTNDVNFSGFTGTISFTNSIFVYGSWNSGGAIAFTGGGNMNFAATSGTKTIFSNGNTWPNAVNFNGIGGTWQLSDALALGSTRTLTVTAGTFDANNKNVTTGLFASSGSTTRTITMGSGTWTISGVGTVWDTTTTTNLTFNANTSSLVFTGSGATVTFQGGGLTYYNVTAPDTLYSFTLSNSNGSLNNFSLTQSAAGEKRLSVIGPITISGTLTLAGSSGNKRIDIASSVYGSITTITAAAVSLTDVNFRDITAAGASIPWTGTRLGDEGNNTNITFASPKTVYWSQVAGGTWFDVAWATSSGGVPASTNQPLPQDTAIFDNTGINSGSSITFANTSVSICEINASSLTNLVTFNTTSALLVNIYGNQTWNSAVTWTGTTSLGIVGLPPATQTIDANGATISNAFSINPRSTCKLLSNFTTSGAGTIAGATGSVIDLNNYALTCLTCTRSGTNSMTLAFGTGSINVTGNNATVWNFADLTGFSYTGTPTVNFTYSGSTGSRFFTNGVTAGATEANMVNFNITAGSDIFGPLTGGNYTGNLTYDPAFTGQAGLPYSSNTSGTTGGIYGNLTLSPSCIASSGSLPLVFLGNTGTKTITTNGVLIDRPLTFNGIGGTWALQDALTLGGTRDLQLYAGTLTTNGYAVTVGKFGGSTATGNRTLNLGSSSFTCVGTATTTASWQVEDSGFSYTVNAGTSTIYMSEPFTGTSTQNFIGSGKTYYNLVFTTTQPGGFYGNNTFNSISNTAQPITVKFAAGSTQTVANFNLSGTSGNLVTLASDTPGSQWYLSKSNGSNVNVSYCSITDSNVSPAGYWYAFTNNGNVNGGNNTGWVFSGNVPVGNGFLMFLS